MTVAHIITKKQKTSGRNNEVASHKQTLFRHHGCPWNYSRRWCPHSSRSWERWLSCRGPSRFIWVNQLIANQNGHASSLSSILATKKMTVKYFQVQDDGFHPPEFHSWFPIFFESSTSRLPRSCPLWPSTSRVVFHRNSWKGSSRMVTKMKRCQDNSVCRIQRSFGVSSWTNSAHNNNCLHKMWTGHFHCLLGRLLVLTFNNLVLICCSLWMCSKTQNTPHAERPMGPCFHSLMSFWKSSSRNMFRFWSTRKFCFSWVFESDTYVVKSSMCAAPAKSSTWLCLSHKSITHKNILWNRELAVMRVSIKKNKKMTFRVVVCRQSQSALHSTSSVMSQRRTGVKTNKVFSADYPKPVRSLWC